MTRKIVALIVTTLLFVGLFPATAAFAAASGSARLTSSSSVFPANDQTATIQVTNNEMQLIGKSINYISVILPVSTAGVVLDERAVSAPSGWSATKDMVGSFHSVVFRPSGTGTGLAPTSSLSLNLPVDIRRPANSDRSGFFVVQLSSDGGRTSKNATAPAGGTLTQSVKILEIVTSTLGPTAPNGVTDNSATGAQEIDYGFAVRNYAMNAVNVTYALSSSDASDSVSGAQTHSVPGDPSQTTPAVFDVTLGNALTDRTSTFTANASATNATAASRSEALSVQAIPQLQLSNLRPARVRSGLGANYAFQVTAAKTGTPQLTLNQGDLSFAATSAALNGTPTFGGGANSQTLNFQQVQVAGSDGSHAPSVTLSGVDLNDKAYSQTLPVNNIIIDNLAPDLSNISIGLPTGQTASKHDDTITVTGCISAPADDLNLSSLRVVLDPNVGADKVVNATTEANTTDCDQYRFEGSLNVGDWDPTATSFVAKAEVADTAGNVGGDVSQPALIDLFAPVLDTPGLTQSSNTIRVQFLDTLQVDVAGGCDPDAWRVDGVPGSVTKVTYTDGRDCLDDSIDVPAGSAGARILHTRFAMDRDDTPPVSYDDNALINEDPAQDGALNDAAARTIDTLSGMVPPAPTITTVTRNNGTETAYSETSSQGGDVTYFTRFPGTGDDDTEDLEVTLAGARNGYIIQVLDEAEEVIATRTVSASLPNGTPLTREFTAGIRVPIGDEDETYRRGLRFVSGATTNLGEVTWINVTLDTVLPAIGGATKVDATTVRVDLSEPVVTGTDFINDWLGYENTADGPQYYRADMVTSTDSQTRTMTFPFQDAGPFGGVHYRMTSPDGIRYEDRAGNLMADTLQ